MTFRPALPSTSLNHMRRGVSYAVTTVAGERIAGEYAGIEVAHDEWALLIMGAERSDSVPMHRVAAVHQL
jgi:hypothetical protein